MPGDVSELEQRRKALGPYLERLKPPVPPWVQALDLDAWELGVLQRVAAGDTNPCSRVVAECTALHVKCQVDLDALHKQAPELAATQALQNELERNAAIGFALADELQQAINLLVLDGQIDQAKKATALRSRMLRGVMRVKEAIGPEATLRAEALAPAMTTRISECKPTAALTGVAQQQVEQARFKPRTRPEPQLAPPRGSRRSALARLAGPWVVIAIALPIVLFVAGKRVLTEPPLPELKQADFAAIPEVSSVLVQSGHVYLTVDGARWAALAAGERQQLLDRIAGVAHAAGYRGAHLRTNAGQLAAQWRENRGTRLF